MAGPAKVPGGRRVHPRRARESALAALAVGPLVEVAAARRRSTPRRRRYSVHPVCRKGRARTGSGPAFLPRKSICRPPRLPIPWHRRCTYPDSADS